MAANNTYFGTWSPSSGAKPDVTGLDFGAYYIYETGTLNGDTTAYKEGDWLIYICEARGTQTERSFWRVSDGLVVFNPDTHTNVPKSGYYTKIRLDNAGNIIYADQLEYDDLPTEALNKFDLISDENIKKNALEVLKTLFVNPVDNPIQFSFDEKTGKVSATLNIDEDTIYINEDGQLCSSGSSSSGDSDSISEEVQSIDLSLYTKQADFEELKKKVETLETNVKLNKPIQGDGIEISEQAGGSVISVSVDGTTIRFNSFGELEAVTSGDSEGGECANHEHTADQITDLAEYIQNYITNVSLIDNIKTNLEDLIDGSSVIINDEGKLEAIAAAVGTHEHVMADITDLDPNKADTWASNQRLHTDNTNEDFDNGIVMMSTLTIGEVLIAFNQLFQALSSSVTSLQQQQGKIKPTEPNGIEYADFEIDESNEIELFDISTGKTVKCSKAPKVYTNDIIYFEGTLLRAYVDDVLTDEVKAYDTEDYTFGTVGKLGNFTFTYFGDAYPKETIFQGFYKGYSFSFSKSGLSEGYHKIKFSTVDVTTKAETFTDSIIVAVYEPVTPDVRVLEVTDLSPNFYVSGVPAYNGTTDIEMKLAVTCATSQFSPINQLSIKDSLHDEVTLTSYDFEDGLAIFDYKTSLGDDFTGKFIIDLIARNADSDTNEDYWTSPYINIDNSTSEKYRVYDNSGYVPSGDGTITTFNEYTPTLPLNTDGTLNEAVIKDDIIKADRTNWSTILDGPDYTSKTGKQYATFRFDLPKNVNNLYVDLFDGDGNALTRDTDGTLKNIELYAGISASNAVINWIDMNDPWIGHGSMDIGSYLYAGLDLYRSTETRRWATLGVRPKLNVSGNLYIKVGFYGTIDALKLIDSVKECLNERK